MMKDQGIGLEEALVRFHNTETFEKLCNRKTLLYIESPVLCIKSSWMNSAWEPFEALQNNMSYQLRQKLEIAQTVYSENC